MWNSINHPFDGFGIRDVQPGQAFHTNYEASYEMFRNVRLGFNGDWLQQTTDDKIDGVNVPHSLERTFGTGRGRAVFQFDHLVAPQRIHRNGGSQSAKWTQRDLAHLKGNLSPRAMDYIE
jgi:hypothetical protein